MWRVRLLYGFTVLLFLSMGMAEIHLWGVRVTVHDHGLSCELPQTYMGLEISDDMAYMCGTLPKHS